MAKSLPTHAELVEYKHAVAGQYAPLPHYPEYQETERPISNTSTAMARFATSMEHFLSSLASKRKSIFTKPP